MTTNKDRDKTKYLVETGDDPVSFATFELSKAKKHLETNCSQESGVIWSRVFVGDKKLLRVLFVWQDQKWTQIKQQ